LGSHYLSFTENRFTSQTPNHRPVSGLTSTSLDRAPAPTKTFVRGKSGYVPFWPGGLEDPIIESSNGIALGSKTKGLRTAPPGFSRGLRLPGEEVVEDDDILAFDEYKSPGPTDYAVLFYRRSVLCPVFQLHVYPAYRS
jgi:antiviral helicase SKI2